MFDCYMKVFQSSNAVKSWQSHACCGGWPACGVKGPIMGTQLQSQRAPWVKPWISVRTYLRSQQMKYQGSALTIFWETNPTAIVI